MTNPPMLSGLPDGTPNVGGPAPAAGACLPGGVADGPEPFSSERSTERSPEPSSESWAAIPPAPPVPAPPVPEPPAPERHGSLMSRDVAESPKSPVPARGVVGRLWSMRTLIAAAITTVALSGMGGAALASAAAGSDDGDNGFGGQGFGRHGQFPPNGQVPNGQVPNGQVPNGQVSNGQVSNGHLPNGQLPNGQVPGLAPSTSDEGRDT